MKNMFKRIFPNNPQEDAEEFANKLPEFKLSMAKIQGHLLKHREDYKAALDKAENLLNETLSKEEMKTSEWLERLNLTRYEQVFKKFGFNYVSDMRRMNKDDFKFTDMKIKNRHHKQRINEMLENDKIAEKDFEYKTMQQTRQILERKLEDENEFQSILKQFGCAEKDVFTGFQLKDVVNKCDTYQKIVDALEQIVSTVKSDAGSSKGSIKTRIDSDDEDTEEEEEEKAPTPEYSLEKLFNELNAVHAVDFL